MTDPRQGTGPGPRDEQGNAADSPSDPPHVPRQERGTPVQRETQAPDDVSVLPATGHGRDKQPTHNQPRDDASMYDGRPGEDKDREPTDMP